MPTFAKPFENRSVQAGAKRRHMVLNRVDAFGLALFDYDFAGYVQFLRKNMNAHLVSQSRSPSDD